MNQNHQQQPNFSVQDFGIEPVHIKGILKQIEILKHKNSNAKVVRKNFQKINGQFETEANSYKTLIQRFGYDYSIYFPFIYDVDFQQKYIYMEELGNDLQAYIAEKRGFDENTAKYFFKQVVKALDLLHSHQIMHGDIKPDNFLMKCNNDQLGIQIKICDFGYSGILEEENQTTVRGTPEYIDFNLLKCWKDDQQVSYNGYKFDVFSLGISLFVSLVNNWLNEIIFLKCYDDEQKFWRVFNKTYKQTQSWSEDLKHLFRQMVNPNEQERWSMQQVLNSNWIQQNLSEEEKNSIEQEIEKFKQKFNHEKTNNSDNRNSQKQDTQTSVHQAYQNLLNTIQIEELEFFNINSKREAEIVSIGSYNETSFKSELTPQEILIILLNEGEKVAKNWQEEGYLDNSKYILNGIFEKEEKEIKYKDIQLDSSYDDIDEDDQFYEISVKKSIQFQIKILQVKDSYKYQSLVEFNNMNKKQNDIILFKTHQLDVFQLILNY